MEDSEIFVWNAYDLETGRKLNDRLLNVNQAYQAMVDNYDPDRARCGATRLEIETEIKESGDE